MASRPPSRGNPDLQRRDIFEGLAPAEFMQPGTGEWPWGDLRNVLLDHEPEHASDAAAARWRQEAEVAYLAVREVALFVRWWLTYRNRKRVSQETAARRMRISRTRLSDFEEGRRFFAWDLPWRIKAVFDSSPAPDEDGPPTSRRR